MVKVMKVIKKKEVAQKPTAIPTVKGKMLASGQYSPKSGQRCLSTSLKGEPCPNAVPGGKNGDRVPYCEKCRKHGDPSLFVTDHPKFGKILVANRNLPKGYRMAWWGDRTTTKKLPDPDWEWALDTTKGVINARPYQKGSLLQFCACPGPHEKVTVWMGPRSDSNLRAKPLTCMLFSTTMPIPKNHQLTMMYNESWKDTDEFFKERGLVRADVGTRKYPCIKKSQFA